MWNPCFSYSINNQLRYSKQSGNIETKSEATDTISRNVALRNELDLFVNVLECQSFANVPSRQKDVNIAIVRQNTEGEYAMLEHEVSKIIFPWFNCESVHNRIFEMFRAFQV